MHLLNNLYKFAQSYHSHKSFTSSVDIKESRTREKWTPISYLNSAGFLGSGKRTRTSWQHKRRIRKTCYKETR